MFLGVSDTTLVYIAIFWGIVCLLSSPDIVGAMSAVGLTLFTAWLWGLLGWKILIALAVVGVVVALFFLWDNLVEEVKTALLGIFMFFLMGGILFLLVDKAGWTVGFWGKLSAAAAVVGKILLAAIGLAFFWVVFSPFARRWYQNFGHNVAMNRHHPPPPPPEERPPRFDPDDEPPDNPHYNQ